MLDAVFIAGKCRYRMPFLHFGLMKHKQFLEQIPQYATALMAVLLMVAAVPFLSAQELGGETTPPVEVAPDAERMPVTDSVGVDPNRYQVGSGDVIGVRVWREPELTMRQTVRPDGKMSMPLLGDVVVNGFTPNEIRDKLTAGLKEFIVNPNVMVEVIMVRSKKFTITGEIGRPGSYPLTGPTTVMDAITNAGGFRDFANRKKIVVIRGEERFKFNYNDVIKGKNRDQNIELVDGDLIVVP